MQVDEAEKSNCNVLQDDSKVSKNDKNNGGDSKLEHVSKLKGLS